MIDMRKGKEFYSKHYETAMELHEKGLSINDIAKELGISYSCVYHWVKGLRKPKLGNVMNFIKFLEENGPSAVAELNFPKHNELFLIARKRGLMIRRKILKRKFGKFATWYYLTGQEDELKNRIDELIEKYRKLKERIFGET